MTYYLSLNGQLFLGNPGSNASRGYPTMEAAGKAADEMQAAYPYSGFKRNIWLIMRGPAK